MSTPLSPEKALRNFLNAIADEADINPNFRFRLLQAMETPFFVEGEDDVASIDPTELAIKYDEASFRRIYDRLTDKSLEIVLVKHGLATIVDVKSVPKTPKAKKTAVLREMVFTRAYDRAREKGRL